MAELGYLSARVFWLQWLFKNAMDQAKQSPRERGPTQLSLRVVFEPVVIMNDPQETLLIIWLSTGEIKTTIGA